jgi:hypothetical protein
LHFFIVLEDGIKREECLKRGAIVAGLFKKVKVYLRADLCAAHTAKAWRHKGRCVTDEEFEKGAAKSVKKRQTKNVKARAALLADSLRTVADNEVLGDELKVDDGLEELYGEHQTVAWSPPRVGPNDVIPVNEVSDYRYESIQQFIFTPKITNTLTTFQFSSRTLGFILSLPPFSIIMLSWIFSILG